MRLDGEGRPPEPSPLPDPLKEPIHRLTGKSGEGRYTQGDLEYTAGTQERRHHRALLAPKSIEAANGV